MSFGIDLLKHLFSLAVIFQHMASETRYSSETNLILSKINDCLDGAVIGFFLLFGFLFKLDDNFYPFIQKKMVRLLLPFLFFSLTYTILLYLSGKATLYNGIYATLTFQGSGPHLYFLSFLIFINIISYIFSPITKNNIISLFLLIILLLILSLGFSTSTSTGSDIKLIPLYLLSFSLGRFIKNNIHRISISLIALAFSLAISFIDKRFTDLSIIILFFIVLLIFYKNFPNKRIPGSGGVYLLHTPITNYGISSILILLGITELHNVIFSAFLTYLFCFLFTYIFINYYPRYKWLLLE